MAKKQSPQNYMIELVKEVKRLINEEIGQLDPVTKNKIAIMNAAQNVFGANYGQTQFPAQADTGEVQVHSPTLHQLTAFAKEISSMGNVTTIEALDRGNQDYYVGVNVKLNPIEPKTN